MDSLGQGKVADNPLLPVTDALSGLAFDGRNYSLNGRPVWSVSDSEKTLTLRSAQAEGLAAPPFTLTFDSKDEHFSTLCRYAERMPCGRIWSGVRKPGGGAVCSAGNTARRKRKRGWRPRPAALARLGRTGQRGAKRSGTGRRAPSVQRGNPFGAPSWSDEMVRRLGLESTLRPPGRPKKHNNGS